LGVARQSMRWQLAPAPTTSGLLTAVGAVPPGHPLRLAGLPPLIVQLLYNRGITNPTQFEPFLAADERLMGDPFLLPGMKEAVDRIRRALRQRETIAVYGDFDADGITGTALLTQGLALLGGTAVPYIPHRFDEGYGLNNMALESLFKQGVTLVITVDCGTRDFDQVAFARSMGLDVIITDHHSVPPILPPALTLINPKRADSSYPFRELAGVGVAFKLLQALFQGSGKEGELDRFLDLVALGTVTDLAPLLGENRYLVKQGLQVINRAVRPALQQLALCAGLDKRDIDTAAISFVLGPCLNAAGRLDHALIGYQLLFTPSPEEAAELAQQLVTMNAERQKLTGEVLAKAREQVLAAGLDLPLLMAAGPDYAAGVIGVVAGKLTDEFYRPAVVLELGEETSRGSARSIPEFDIIAALTQCEDLFTRFGGHPQAAGFTIPTTQIALLRERLLALAGKELANVDLRPALMIDAEVKLTALSGGIMKQIEQLAPFGQGNPQPAFLTRGMNVVECRKMGNGGEHLRFKLREGSVIWDAVGFGLGGKATQIDSPLDIVYNLEVDKRSEYGTLQLNLLDFAPTRQRKLEADR